MPGRVRRMHVFNNNESRTLVRLPCLSHARRNAELTPESPQIVGCDMTSSGPGPLGVCLLEAQMQLGHS